MRIIQGLVGGLLSTVALGAITPAMAQQTGAEPDSTTAAREPAGPNDYADIVVTARKQSERLFDVPQSVSAVTGDDLEKLGASQFRDFAATIPGLSFGTQGAGYSQITLRGVTSGVDVSPTVGTYVDDVPYGSSSGFADSARRTLDVGLFDVDRVEVLRGPQGTLYGAGAMGGVIKYVTKLPSLTTITGDVRAGISDTENGGVSYELAAAVSAPLVEDKIGIRASGFYFRDGGFIDNLALNEKDVNRSKIYGGRVDALFKPSERLSIRLTGFAQNIKRAGEGTADYNYDGTPIAGELTQNRKVREPFDQEFRLASAVIRYEGDDVDISAISGYQTSKGGFSLDVTALYQPIMSAFFGRDYSAIGVLQGADVEKFTQELRVSGDTGPISWVIGGFYTDENAEFTQDLTPLFDAAGNPAVNDVLHSSRTSRFEEIAGFGNLTWKLTDKFDVSGGLRVARNKQGFEETGTGLFGRIRPTRTSAETVDTYSASVRYRFSDQVMSYARFATGYRPGGPNFVGVNPTGPAASADTFQADKLNSYEVGLRGRTIDNRFSLDVSAYKIDWSNIQISTVVGGFSVIANAPGARIYGAEASATFRPSDAFSLTSAFAYQDAKLTEAEASLGAARGDRLPNVPKFTVSLSGDYRLAIGSFQPQLGATLRSVSKRWASFDGNTGYLQYKLPDYAVLDLRASAQIGIVTAQVYLKNVFDDRAELSALNWRGPAMPALVQPRTVGLMLSSHF